MHASEAAVMDSDALCAFQTTASQSFIVDHPIDSHQSRGNGLFSDEEDPQTAVEAAGRSAFRSD